MRLKFIFLLSVLLLSASYSFAGVISPELLDKMNSLSQGETIPVWIEIENAVDGQVLKKDLTDRYELRADRYREAMSKFKNTHTAAQAKVVSKLNQQFNKSNRRIKTHWLINVIEADLTKDEIYQYASDNDVVTIYLEPEIELIPVDETEKDIQKNSATAQNNLLFINARQAWQQGFTGEGRVVCSFDTGVEGDHPALAPRWKGLDGDSSAAWFDPTDNEPFPHIFTDCGCNINHGTHTMGIMVGVNPSTNDTIGVAPGAKWISAGVLDIPGASFLDAFEWAADPDRNPNTISDVPDVINHSWGLVYNGVCDDIFYSIIENTEALGIVNIFSAGNEGSNAGTIRNPANRALDSLDCFAVGNVNDETGVVLSNSSRGPTSCPSPAIKPNVAAPGYLINSSISGGGYALLSGTSMAAPHVSGLVALLRQKNPNATVDEIKNAILLSADNNGETVPNNNIGWGIIDCNAALALVSDTISTPLIKIYDLVHDQIIAGDTITASLVLKNFGQQASMVTAAVMNSNSAITVVNGTASFGTMMQHDTTVGSADLVFVLDDTVTTGSTLYTNIQITAAGYSSDLKLALSIPPFDNNRLLTHSTGDINFTISSYGSYGYGSGTPIGGGSGFTYMSGSNDLWTAGFMIGKAPNYVSDGASDGSGDFDGDFTVLPSSELNFVSPKPGVTEQSYTRFTDSRAHTPMGLDVTQEVYGFDYAPYTDFVIMRFIIHNVSDSTLSNLYAGLCFDWDVPPSYSSNAGGYEVSDELLWLAYNNGSQITDSRGLKMLEPTMTTTFTGQGSTIYPPNGYTDPADGFTEFEKITALSNGFLTADTYKSVQSDLFQVGATQLTLASQQIDTVAFAVLAGDTYADIQTAAANASTAYNGVVTDVDDTGGPDELPQSFLLSQNYPNPFNPTTTIEFSLPQKSEYTFEVFNLLGQKVFEETQHVSAGVHKIVWDGSDLSSGVYLYKLTTERFADAKKMVLLK
ncbi:MAG: T9SS C-terminal target domain-containing protein [Calditrichaeota bacterium]|nr:MAG: T9SS C-terminal target domain-containing protein [Calditrichota bacterium]